MKLLKKLAISSVLSLSFIANAHALEWYLGLDGYQWEFEDENLPSKIDGTSVRGRLGFVISQNVVVETQFAAPGTETESGGEVDFQNMFNFLVQGVYPIGKANLYGVLGLSSVRTSRKYAGRTFSGRENGFSYGVGANYRINKHLAINGDYIQYLDKSIMKLGAVSVGLTYYFFSKQQEP
ncbi:porin family protein [Kaarinaea lacus]